MPTPAECLAAYEKCLGPNPTPSQQIACQFAYAACLHENLASLVQAHVASLEGTPPAAAKPAKKTAKKSKRKPS